MTLTLNPSNVSAAYARASCHNLIGNYQQAIEDYTSALQQDAAKLKGKERSMKGEASPLPSPTRSLSPTTSPTIDGFPKKEDSDRRENVILKPVM
jgi:hypothetical protein